MARAQTFVDTWSSAGFSGEASQGVVLGDADGDGRTDVFLPGHWTENPLPFLPPLGAPNALWRNRGDGTFQDEAPARGLDDAAFSFGGAWADLDNDGALDLYVVRGLQASVPLSHLLYRQRSDGTFDAAASADVEIADAGRSVCWADHDSDGLVDVFVTNGLDSGDLLPDASVRLFRNTGEGFEDVTSAVGIVDRRNAQGCAWSDFDDDGDQDLFVANHGFEDPVLGFSDPQADALYRNMLVETGTATFVDVAVEAGVDGIAGLAPGEEGGGASFGAAWGDFNGDALMDLFVTTGFSGLIPFPTPNRLYVNRGDGTFEDRSLTILDPDFEESSYAVTLADFDNDGDLDAFVGNAHVPAIAEATNDLLVNSGPPFHVLTNEEASSGVGIAAWTQGAASADFDGDGDVDIYATDGTPGAELVTLADDHLFMNAGNDNHWLHLDLVGRASNRAAIGARVVAEVGGRLVVREVTAGSGFQSMDDLRVELGLGDRVVVDRVEIRWPSGCVQELVGVAADQVLEIVEECVAAPATILRREVQRPRSGTFPLPPHVTIPATDSSWIDPDPVVGDGRLLFYAHSGDVSIRLERTASSVLLSW